MVAPSLQTLLREGIAAAKLAQRQSLAGPIQQPGPQEQARELLLQVVEFDATNIPAWLWLSTVVDSPAEKRLCLENVLALDPGNKHALAGLARLQPAAPAPEVKPTPAQPKYRRLKTGETAQARPASATSTRGDGPLCPFCRRPISTIDKVCAHCRLPLVMLCPACSAAIDVEQSSCSQCRQPVGNYQQPLHYFAQLGTAYQKNGRHQEAVKAWQAVERLQPDYPHLQLHLGKAQLGLGRPDRAWDSLQRALKQDRTNADIHFALGELVWQRGEHEQAFKHYDAAIQLDPRYALAWFRRGQIYQKARRSQEASQAYQQALKLLPPNSAESGQAQEQLAQLRPGLPENMATSWFELFRQMTGPVVVSLLAALLDAGLRPWWIPLTGWLALLLAVSGAFLAVSGAGLPRNPLIRLMVGERGLASSGLKISLVLLGGMFWLLALALILLPLGQSYPEPPQL